MEFKVEEIESFYNEYSIKKGTNGDLKVTLNDEVINDENIINDVKFAYLWVYANALNKYDNYFEKVNQEDYLLAFNEESNYLYQLIMEYSYEVLEETGLMISQEELINFIMEEDDIKENFIQVITKLYNYESIFETWIIS